MKKLIMTIAIVLGMCMTTFAQADPKGGLFQRGETPENGNRDGSSAGLALPGTHGLGSNADADQVPVGTGIAVLAVLGGAYLVGKRRKEE
jgi:hypothetical protein